MFRRQPTSGEWRWRNEGKFRGRCFGGCDGSKFWLASTMRPPRFTTADTTTGPSKPACPEPQEDCVLIADVPVSTCCQHRCANRGIEHNRAGSCKSSVQAMSQSGTYPHRPMAIAQIFLLSATVRTEKSTRHCVMALASINWYRIIRPRHSFCYRPRKD